MPSWKKVILSGSDAALNSLAVSTNITASSFTGSFTGSFLGTASFAVSASHAVLADTASFLPATTNLNINSISASTAVFTSASIGFLTTVSGSATIIGDAYVVVNSSQATRYAGLAVYESGSNPPVTASWNFDSQTNDWFYGYSSSDGTDYAVAIFGPEYTTKGSPTYLTSNVIPKAGDQHHIIDSNLSDNGSRVSSAVPFTVTGSITASAGFLGNLTGTASYASQALSSSFATTASFAQNFNPLATASYALQALSSSYALTASFANTASYVATASYTPNLQQVTTKGNTTTNTIIVSSSLGNSILTIDTGSILVSNLIDGPVFGKTHHVIYDAISITANSTTTITQLPAPAVAGFTFDYIAYVSGGVLQAGRAGVVKGILRNTETGVVTKAFQLNETTTLDLEDDGFGTAGLQFTIIQDTNGTSNQLVAITNNNWPYIINYTLTIYYNPNFS